MEHRYLLVCFMVACATAASAESLRSLSAEQTLDLIQSWDLTHAFGQIFEENKYDGFTLDVMTKADIDAEFANTSPLHRRSLYSRVQEFKNALPVVSRQLKAADGKKPEFKGKPAAYFKDYLGVKVTKDKAWVTLGTNDDIKLYRDEKGTLQIEAKNGINFASSKVTLNGGPLSTKPVNYKPELSQIRRCSFTPTSNKNNAGNSHTFTAAECGGPIDFAKKKCAVAIKASSAGGGDEDWMAYNNPPRVSWWIRGGGAPGGRIEVEYLCPNAGTKLSDEWTIQRCKATSARKPGTYTFSNAECGGKVPANVQNCFAAVGQRSQSGSDEDWGLLSGTNSLKFSWYCSGCTAAINFQVDYICPKKSSSLWKVHMCQAKISKEQTLKTYQNPYGLGKFNLHKWTASECGGSIPTGRCFSSVRRVEHCGPDEDYMLHNPWDPEGASIAWYNIKSCAVANIAGDYLCIPQDLLGAPERAPANLAAEKSQLTTCKHAVKFGGSNKGFSIKFTAAECGGSLAFQNKNCAVGIKSASHSGGDEDWRALLKPPGFTWYVRGGASASGTAAANYLCPNAKSDLDTNWDIVHCKSTVKTSSAASKSHTFTFAECGSKYVRHIEKCAVVSRERSQSGSDEDWMVKPGKYGLTSTWWCSSCTSAINLAVDYICPSNRFTGQVSRWKAYSCGAVLPASKIKGSSHAYTFTANDCGGQAPTGFCMGSVRGGTHSGGDEDWQAHTSPAKVTWWCSSCSGSATIYADYMCYDDS